MHYDGCNFRDGVRGGSAGAIYWRWQSISDYDDAIYTSQNHRRFLQIEYVKKLNNKYVSPKRGK